MNTLASLFAFKTWSDTELFSLLGTLPTETDAQAKALHAAVRTLNHIHIADRIFRGHLAGEPHGFEATNTKETPSLEALRSAVAETDAWFEAYVGATSAAALQEQVAFTFTDGDAGRMSREEMLLHVITHGAYHRGNVGQVLRSIGINPPRDLYTRYLHLDQPARRAGRALRIEVDDLSRPAIHALLEEHLHNMHALGPPESVHALDLAKLRAPGITFWSAWEGDDLMGCGALSQLDPTHGEIKSMRTPQARRRTGAGRALLMHIINEACSRGYERLSLETGTVAAFEPAHRLYESAGFVRTGPFGDYVEDPNSAFMTLLLTKQQKTAP